METKKCSACKQVLSIDNFSKSGKGYVPGNVQWVSWRVNRAKGEQTQEQFLEMCRAVLNA